MPALRLCQPAAQQNYFGGSGFCHRSCWMQLQPLQDPPCLQAIDLQPDEGFEKYMYLSQFLSGDEALQAARRGLDVLQRQLDGVVRLQYSMLYKQPS